MTILFVFSLVCVATGWVLFERGERQSPQPGGLNEEGRIKLPLGDEDVASALIRQEKRRKRQRFILRGTFGFILGFGTTRTLFDWSRRGVTGANRFQDIAFNRPDLPKTLDRFSWNDLTPSKELIWVDCYEENLCARLEVPLDWNSTASGPKAAIAVIKKPAEVPVTDSRYAGAILSNPGGPGGTGVGFHLLAASSMRGIVDTPAGKGVNPEDEKYFDLIGFDPRGVGVTTPKAAGFDEFLTWETWILESTAIGLDVKDHDIFEKVWARNNLYGQIVADGLTIPNTKANSSAGAFVTTPMVARDMVEIIEAHGRWRDAETHRLLKGRTDAESEEARARTMYKPGEALLNYWGFSYGTALGQTFASLYPHRVNRVVLDGVVDAKDYATGSWSKNLFDIDKITWVFAEHCMSHPTKCPISNWGGKHNSTSKFVSRVYKTVEDLKDNPIMFFHRYGDTTIPYTVTYSTMMAAMFGLWYSPVVGFPVVSNLLDSVDRRDFKPPSVPSPPIMCPVGPMSFVDIQAANTAIRCADAGPAMRNITKGEIHSWMNHLQGQSAMFSDMWSQLRMGCPGFSPQEPEGHEYWRFHGPFGVKTKNPILFASQALDPVTPLRNAIHAAEKLFPGAGVLNIKDGAGHSTLAWPSLCATKAIRRFFATGDVGRTRKIDCEGSFSPFDDWGVGNDERVDAEVNHVLSMSDAWRKNGFGLGHRLDAGDLHGITNEFLNTYLKQRPYGLRN